MIYYHIPTQQEVDDFSDIAKKLTRCGTPALIMSESPDFVPVVRESLGSGQKYGEPIIEETRRYYPAVDLSQEEIDYRKKDLITAISNSCRDYIETRANSSLIIQLTLNAESATPHQMAIETLQWGSVIAMDAEDRKAQVLAGVTDDYATLCDFSSHGDKPYTVYQLYLAGVVKFYLPEG